MFKMDQKVYIQLMYRKLTMRSINLKAFDHKGLMILLVACLLMTVPALGGQYEISWYTIDGGGGQSIDGQFILTGTIGQPDAGYSYGGDFEVLGGFWPGGLVCIADIVNFYDFAKFAQYWLETGPDLPADLYEDNIVDLFDLNLFVDEWLLYRCQYNWPLK